MKRVVSLMFLFFVLVAVYFLYVVDALFWKRQSIKVGTNFWHGYEILYLARSLGHLPDNVKLVEFNTTSEVKRSYRNGLINAMALTIDEALRLLADGHQIRVIMVFDISEGADVVIARENIEDPQDLKGKRIGVEQTALGAYMLYRFLENKGLKQEDVEVKVLELHEHYNAFVKGDVDLVITFEPEKSKILKEGGHVIFSSRDIPGEIVDVLVVDASLTKQVEALKGLLEGYFRAYEYYNKNRGMAYTMMSRRLGLTPEEIAKSFDGVRLPDFLENKKMLLSDIMKNNIERICDAMKSKNMLSKDLNCSVLLDEKIVRRLYEAN
ncbi:MAG: ABC transporter substrate-binding protein [Aquificaceae bacterium]|nr:ABC transporter substrate-binding protein [Aquificaceae bacterium]